MSKEEYFKFNLELCGMPGRKGSVADYWRSLDKEKIVEFMSEQCHFTDYFLEQRDKLEKKVNDLSRDKRQLEKEVAELREKLEDSEEECGTHEYSSTEYANDAQMWKNKYEELKESKKNV